MCVCVCVCVVEWYIFSRLPTRLDLTQGHFIEVGMHETYARTLQNILDSVDILLLECQTINFVLQAGIA